MNSNKSPEAESRFGPGPPLSHQIWITQMSRHTLAKHKRTKAHKCFN